MVQRLNRSKKTEGVQTWGLYIQTKVTVGKAAEIVREHKATVLPNVQAARQAFMEGFGVICVVQNGPFDAAAYCFSMKELEVFADPSDARPKTWLSMSDKLAKQLTGG